MPTAISVARRALDGPWSHRRDVSTWLVDRWPQQPAIVWEQPLVSLHPSRNTVRLPLAIHYFTYRACRDCEPAYCGDD